MSWTILEASHRVKTRNAHVCDGCGRRWPAGTLMVTWTGVHYGEVPMRVYLCLVCYRYWRHYCGATREVEFDGCIPDWDPDCYVRIEAKLALYVVAAGVEPMAPHLGIWR